MNQLKKLTRVYLIFGIFCLLLAYPLAKVATNSYMSSKIEKANELLMKSQQVQTATENEAKLKDSLISTVNALTNNLHVSKSFIQSIIFTAFVALGLLNLGSAFVLKRLD